VNTNLIPWALFLWRLIFQNPKLTCSSLKDASKSSIVNTFLLVTGLARNIRQGPKCLGLRNTPDYHDKVDLSVEQRICELAHIGVVLVHVVQISVALPRTQVASSNWSSKFIFGKNKKYFIFNQLLFTVQTQTILAYIVVCQNPPSKNCGCFERNINSWLLTLVVLGNSIDQTANTYNLNACSKVLIKTT